MPMLDRLARTLAELAAVRRHELGAALDRLRRLALG
jgi:hypothetical protein